MVAVHARISGNLAEEGIHRYYYSEFTCFYFLSSNKKWI